MGPIGYRFESYPLPGGSSMGRAIGLKQMVQARPHKIHSLVLRATEQRFDSAKCKRSKFRGYTLIRSRLNGLMQS